MVTHITTLVCWGLLVAVLASIAGCPPQVEPALGSASGTDQISQDLGQQGPDPTVLHALPPDLTALLNAAPVDAPTAGASALANTRWWGTDNCVLTGDINMLISGPGTRPMSDEMSFNEHGLPSGEITGFPWQFKRAKFTADSFDLGCTTVMSMSTSGESSSAGYVLALSGKRSADGRTLTGRRRLGVIYAYDGPAADVAMTYDCTFTLDLVE